MFRFLDKESICLACVMFSLLPGSAKSFLRGLTMVPILLQTHIYEAIPFVCVHVYKRMFRKEAMKWAPFQKPLFVLASFSSPFLLIIWRTLACAWCPSKWEEPSANCAPLFKPSVIALRKPLQSPACCPCFCLSNSCVEVGCVWSSSRRRAAKIMREGAGESKNASHLTASEKRENGSLWSRML